MAWGRVLHLSKISTLCGGMFEVPSKYIDLVQFYPKEEARYLLDQSELTFKWPMRDVQVNKHFLENTREKLFFVHTSYYADTEAVRFTHTNV